MAKSNPPTVPRLLLALALPACVLVGGPAQAQIYKCEGPDGVVEYSNSPAAAQGNRRCSVVQLNPITTIPAPRLPPRATAPAGGAAANGAAGSTAPGAANAARPAGSEGFPRVDTATQRVRDNDRRAILDEELKKEEEKLAELRKEYNDGEPERLGSERNYQRYLDRVQRLKDDIGRSEANIASIKRELAAIRN